MKLQRMLTGGVALVDVAAMALIDATSSTPETLDLFDPGFTSLIRSVHFFDNTNGLVILGRTAGKAAFVRGTADDYTATAYQDPTTTAKGFSLAADADGKIWMAISSGVRAFDPATGHRQRDHDRLPLGPPGARDRRRRHVDRAP